MNKQVKDLMIKVTELERELDNREKRIDRLETFNRKNLNGITKARTLIDKAAKELTGE